MTQQPKIYHVHSTQSLSLDGAIDNAHGGRVIDVDGDGRLGMSHLLKGESHTFCFHRVEEQSAELGFGSGDRAAF